MTSFKITVFHHYKNLLDDKISALQRVLDDLKESGSNETKSTAGDKHETALAMLQIEQANKRAQMKDLLEQRAVLNKFDPTIQAIQIVPGSLVKAATQYYFVSVALGKAMIEGRLVIALSPLSPLGKTMLGARPGEKVGLNQVSFTIDEIL